MEKITNYFQLNQFIESNIKTKKYKDNRNLTIDSCDISEKLLLKYISKSYRENDENSMFNCYTIYSYFNNNLMEIKKNISNIEQTSKLEVVIVLVNLSDEAFDNLSTQNKFYYLHLINIKDYKPEIIPSWKEQIFSVLLLISPLGYLIYKYYKEIKSYIEKIYNYFNEILKFLSSDAFIITSVIIYDIISSFIIIPILIYWMFKAFALRIKGLLPLSSFLYALNTILLLYLNTEFLPNTEFIPYISLKMFAIFMVLIFIPFISYMNFKRNEFRSDLTYDSISSKIISGESNIIDPITYFKNRKNKK